MFLHANFSTSFRTLLYGLEDGGPAGLIYGYLLAWCGASLQALVMAEMASMYVKRLLMPSGFTCVHMNITCLIARATLESLLSTI